MKSRPDEPVYAGLVLAKCAAGLVVIALIAVIGLDAPIDSASRVPRVAAEAAPGTRADARAEPHRKKVFDGRRAYFDGGENRRGMAGEKAQPAKRLSIMFRSHARPCGF